MQNRRQFLRQLATLSELARSVYSSWPTTNSWDTGRYAVYGDGDISADDGENTIYLVALPKDVVPGDTIRVQGHCLIHGEYVDFLTI